MAFRFSRAYVEYIHDDIVSLPVESGDEPVSPHEYRDIGLIESACARPFQTFFGEELYPSLFQKAAAFFHSLVCNHCFGNGNKRTALTALDMFMTANGMFFGLDNDDAYELARSTASHNADGRDVDEVVAYLAELIEESSILFKDLINPDIPEFQEYSQEAWDVYEASVYSSEEIRTHPLNKEVNEDAETVPPWPSRP